MERKRLRRRQVLALAGGLAAVTLAGCSDGAGGDGQGDDSQNGDGTGDVDDGSAGDGESGGDQDDGTTTGGGGDDTETDEEGEHGTDSDTGDDPTTADGAATDTPTGEAETETATATPERELDLREANVVGVEFEEAGDAYNFDVTLHHDDNGEEGYANWWQVERLDGTQLGRRELLHAHSRQPFTRSETIDVPGDVSCVVVRGHDQTHGYGGRAVLVNLDSGATAAIRQGSDRRSVDENDCP